MLKFICKQRFTVNAITVRSFFLHQCFVCIHSFNLFFSHISYFFHSPNTKNFFLRFCAFNSMQPCLLWHLIYLDPQREHLSYRKFDSLSLFIYIYWFISIFRYISIDMLTFYIHWTLSIFPLLLFQLSKHTYFHFMTM